MRGEIKRKPNRPSLRRPGGWSFIWTMPWICIKCGYKTNEFPGNKCPDCGGLMEEKESEIDWEGEGEKKEDEDDDDDIVL